ncbi:hypothetical protein ACFLZE_02990 [Thermodesulfobacteriota bacterium]
MEGWANVKNIAKYMGFSERTVRTLLKEGLPHVRLPKGSIRIKYSEADNYLMQFEVKETDAGEIIESICEELGVS